jgi:N-acyl-D-aspartate/D-glutamate deacylase
VLQLVSDFDDIDAEFEMVAAMVEQSGMPLGFTLTYRQDDDGAQRVRALLDRVEAANSRGVSVVGQVAPRAIGLLFGLGCTLNPFSTNRVFKEIEPLSPAERVLAMRNGDFRKRLFENLNDDADYRVGSHLLGA